MRGHKDGFHLTVLQFRSLNVLQPLRIPTPAARPRSCRSDRANCYLRRGTRMAPAATVDRRRYPDVRPPDVLVDGLGGRCKASTNLRTRGKSAELIFGSRRDLDQGPLLRDVCFAPQERTSSARSAMSEKCHFRTHAPQQSAAIRSPCGHWRATRATPLSEGPQ